MQVGLVEQVDLAERDALVEQVDQGEQVALVEQVDLAKVGHQAALDELVGMVAG